MTGPHDATEPTTLLAWRSEVTDEELVALTLAGGGEARAGVLGSRPRPFARLGLRPRGTGRLIEFVDVAWDGGDHAFLLDPTVAPEHRRRGLACAPARSARQAGCEWLHVDVEDDLGGFYLRACGFRPTRTSLRRLR